MNTVERVEAIKVLTNTLHVIKEMKSMVADRDSEIAKAIGDKILSYIKLI